MDHSLHVAVDVGSRLHEVAVSDRTGRVLDAFRIDHEPEGFGAFFERVAGHRSTPAQAVRAAMESYNDWARPLDSLVLERDWALYNVNNLKLARYKEIFPAPAKSDAIDSHRILELLTLDGQRGVARNALQRVTVPPDSHRRMKYLTRRRRVLVQERVGRATRLRCDLQALSPGLPDITGAADNQWFLRFVTCRDRLTALPRLHARTLAGIRGVGPRYLARIRARQRTAHSAPDIAFADTDIVDDASAIMALDERIAVLDGEIGALSRERPFTRILRSMPGIGVAGAAELTGELGSLERFSGEASFALYLGMAPVDHS